MLSNANNLLEVAEQKRLEMKHKKTEKLTRLIKKLLSDVYEYPQRLTYSKLLSHNELRKGVTVVDLNENGFERINDVIVKAINTNTDLFAYHNISGIYVTWHPEWVIKKKDEDVDANYALALDMRIDVEELQRLSKQYWDNQKQIEDDNFKYYLIEVINKNITKRTNLGLTDWWIHGDVLEEIIKSNDMSETRSVLKIMNLLCEYIENETDYWVSFEDNTEYQRGGHERNLNSFYSLRLKWDRVSLEEMKTNKESAMNENKICTENINLSNEKESWFKRTLRKLNLS